jgi:hypothetical protein
MMNTSELNTNPRAKLQKLRELLQTPGITSIQQARIFKLIQETESKLADATPRASANHTYSMAPQLQHPSYIQQQYQQKQHQALQPSYQSSQQQPQIPSYMSRTVGMMNGAANNLALVPTPQPLKNPKGMCNGAGAGDMSRFETDEQIREREFEEELNRKRHEFRRQQEQRRQEYLNKLREMESGNVDSLRLLGLNPNYTIEELKAAYKRMAMETHPDRPGGNTEKFQLVTQCYMSLLERLKGQTPAKSAMDLRADARAAYTTSGEPTAGKGAARCKSQVPTKFINPDGQGFNVKLFNKLYEENKIWDPNDDGYEDWLRKGDVDEIRKAPPVFSKSFNIGVFNSTFEDWKNEQRTARGGSGQIQKYDRPQELISTSSGYTVLDGGEPIRDFTKSLDSPGALNYSDLKAAYTGGCDMIDPRTVDARKEYRNVDELIRDRDRLDYVLSPEDAALEERYAREREQREQDRLSRMAARDNLVGQHYTTTHERLIGRVPDSDNPAALTYQPKSRAPNPHATNQLQYQRHQYPQSGNMLTSSLSGRAPSTAAGMVRLPPPVSPAAIAAATTYQQAPALTYVAQANNLRARSGTS